MSTRTELIKLLTPHATQKSSLSEHYEGVWIQADGATIEARSVSRYGATRTVGETNWDFAARVSCEALLRALKASKDEVDSIQVDNKNRLEIQMGAHVVRLPTYPPPEWPAEPQLKEPQSGRLASQVFLAVAVASDESDKKPTCNGVQIEDGWMFATDSYRLHAAKTVLTGSLRLPRTIEGILKAVNPPITLEYDARRFRLLDSEGLEHVAALGTRAPIKWQALLRERDVFLEFQEEDGVEFVLALQRANKISDEPGILRVRDGMLALSTRDEVTETFLLEDEFPLSVAFNMQYLLDAIAFVGWDDTLTLEFTDEKSPIVLQCEDRLAMVMPVRV